MKLGFFVAAQYMPHESMERKILENLEQVRAARDAGFDLISTGEHYLSAPYQMPACFPLLARLSAEAGEMDVAATVILVPLHNPVDMAETVSTMDAICNGRFIFGIGLGYRDEEYTAFGIRRTDRVPRLLEALEVMKLLWTQDEVEYEGNFFRIPRVKSTCRTVQQPHPPIWVAANANTAIDRAARLGYPWLINPHATFSLLQNQLDLYRQALAESGNPPPSDMPMMRELYIAEDREAAFLESGPYLASKYQSYADWGQHKALPGNESFSVPFEELSRDRFLIGTPDDVVREIKRYRDSLGVNCMIFRMQWPGMEQAKVLKQLNLMSRYVLPQVKPESTEGRPWGQPLKKPAGAPLNLG